MKAILISIFVVVLMILGVMVFAGKNFQSENEPTKSGVTLVDGKQIIDLTAKGGYSPRRTVAKAGVPTILRINTTGTFDCSSAVRIPSMNISANLPASGSKDIDLGTPKVSVLKGTCAMGMYPFEIDFQS